MDSLAKRLKYVRDLRELTQDDLCEASGVKQSDISKLERGKSLKTTNLVQLAKALKCRPEWLATGEGDMQPTGARLTAPSFQISASGGPSSNEITVGMALNVLATAIAASENKASDSLVGTLASFAKDPRNPIHQEVLELLLTKQIAPESSQAA